MSFKRAGAWVNPGSSGIRRFFVREANKASAWRIGVSGSSHGFEGLWGYGTRVLCSVWIHGEKLFRLFGA